MPALKVCEDNLCLRIFFDNLVNLCPYDVTKGKETNLVFTLNSKKNEKVICINRYLPDGNSIKLCSVQHQLL